MPLDFQQAGQFQQMINPPAAQAQAAAPAEGPPTTPAELEQRKTGWASFIHNLQNDPATQQAAFMAAGQLMKGPGMGESHLGAMGRALQLGTMAHGFIKGNTTLQQQEQQRLAEQQRLNTSNIEQNTAQTNGLLQQQEFARQAQPYTMQKTRQDISAGDFQAQTRDTLFKDTLKNTAADRQYKSDLGDYRKKLGDRAVAGTGPKTPAGVAMFERTKQALIAANPRMEGEDEMDYQGRIEGMALDYNKKPAGGGNPNAVRVQALTQTLNNSDPGTPEYAAALKGLQDIGTGTGQAPAGNPAVPKAGAQSFPKEAFDRAANIAKSAGKSTFIGPDGQTYKVK